MAARVGRRETGEGFTTAQDLLDAGFMLEPFWEQAGDIEGDTYREYIKKYPNFELVVREGVFERLKQAQSQLPDGWRMVLKAGFRPLGVQTTLLDAFKEKSRADHPDWNEERHLEHARTFVSDPTLVCPPHVTGGAVDVAIKDIKTGDYVDMGCEPNTDNEISFLHSPLATKEQYDNRMILLDAMLDAGFAPNVQEWWHYQYGETYWAAFYGETTTLYDVAGM
jgi:D-alanyl-D-alanine dipeptidase